MQKKKKKNGYTIDGRKVVKVFSKFLFQDFFSIRGADNFSNSSIGWRSYERIVILEIYNFKR